MKSSSGLVLPDGMTKAACLISMVSVFTSPYPLGRIPPRPNTMIRKADTTSRT